MSKSAPQARPQASIAEQFAGINLSQWKGVVTQIHDPMAAYLIVQALDAVPEAKAANLGVYLAAKVTIRRSQVIYARWKRFGSMFGSLVRLARRGFGSAKPAALSTDQSQPLAEAPYKVEPQAADTVTVTAAASQSEETLVFPTIIFPVAAIQAGSVSVH